MKICHYNVILRQVPSGRYVLTVPSIPEIHIIGKTEKEVKKTAKKKIKNYTEAVLKKRQQTPWNVNLAIEQARYRFRRR